MSLLLAIALMTALAGLAFLSILAAERSTARTLPQDPHADTLADTLPDTLMDALAGAPARAFTHIPAHIPAHASIDTPRGPDENDGDAPPHSIRSLEASLIRQLDALLPQTQCGRCTYAGCLPYARAIARGEADTNQCPPGGLRTAIALAHAMGREPKPVDPRFGVVPDVPQVAWIDEPACIGCTKCIQACPVDAIVGASRYMHTVIASHCTGCELCIPPCPVDCIEMRPAPRANAATQPLLPHAGMPPTDDSVLAASHRLTGSAS